MRAWGANVATDWPVQPNPPLTDHPHTRAAYAKWLHAQQAGTLLIVGGQTPTLRNPPRSQTQPVWDMSSILGHAGDHGLSWKAYTGTSSYPVRSTNN
jgi:phospholipase C